MIRGAVNDDGVPIVMLALAGNDWPAIIDTGFNGDLELPNRVRGHVNARFKGRFASLLAGGQTIMGDTYRVEFPFDGQTIIAEATFVSGGEILIGTHLLRRDRLEIDFLSQTVLLDNR